MIDDEKFGQFIQRIMQRPIPDDPFERLEAFAREIAEGALREIWDFYLEFGRLYQMKLGVQSVFHDKNRFESRYFDVYLYRRWDRVYPRLELLEVYGYISLDDTGFR